MIQTVAGCNVNLVEAYHIVVAWCNFKEGLLLKAFFRMQDGEFLYGRSVQSIGDGMESTEFSQVRKRLGKTQKEMAEVLGTSVKAVHSYEQGWRCVPAHVERQLLFFLTRLAARKGGRPCWTQKGCKPNRKERCPAWEYQAGDMCWFISGTLCDGLGPLVWEEKMVRCRRCTVLDFKNLIKG